jgi:hypothetical protein
MNAAPASPWFFPHDTSFLRLAPAVLSDINNNWETDRSYLNMEVK